MTLLQERSKVSQAKNIDKETLFAARTEKVEMTLNTDSALAQSLLIQRLTELYEDPIEATVRETVSNAIDAVSVATSGSEPEVHIYKPTSLNPVFTVKDNGVGMTYEDLKNVYSKYGASTKADDLEQIGAYGLGAKAPLSYGTEFTVTSVKDGEKTTIMVAREEMTNFIKIVESKETDEPTGTTVSIPLKNSDVLRFEANIKKYQETPIDKNVKLFIDDEPISTEQFTLLSDKILIHKGDKNTFGRVWVENDKIIQLLSDISIERLKNSLNYVIGGWSYKAPSGRRGYGGNLGIVVELKAGIVGFNSARDAILENDKYTDLETLVIEYISSEKFIDDTTKMMNNLELSEFKKQISILMSRNFKSLKIKNGKITIDNSKSMSSHYNPVVKRDFELSKFVHAETGFKFDNIIKNVPTNGKNTVAFEESRNFGQKTVMNNIFSTDEYSPMFNHTTVSGINKYVDEVFNNEEEGHNLSDLMMGLSTLVYNRNERSTQMAVTFVTDMSDEKELKKAKSGRKSIVRMSLPEHEDFNYNSIIVFTEHSKLEIEKMFEGLGMESKVVLKIEDVKSKLEDIAKFKKKNVKKVAATSGLSTKLEKVDFETKRLISSDLSNFDKKRENLLFVTKSRHTTIKRAEEALNWFCNTKEISQKDVDVYISSGTHKNTDINLIAEATENYYLFPYTEKAGSSKLYEETFANRKAEAHGFNKEDYSNGNEVIMRILMGATDRSISRMISQLETILTTAYEIAEIASVDLPEYPTKSFNEMKLYEEKKYPGVSNYHSWYLTSSAMVELGKELEPEELDFCQDLASLVTHRQIIKSVDGITHMDLNTFGVQNTSLAVAAYKNKTLSKSGEMFAKASTEAYLSLVKSCVEELGKKNFYIKK